MKKHILYAIDLVWLFIIFVNILLHERSVVNDISV